MKRITAAVRSWTVNAAASLRDMPAATRAAIGSTPSYLLALIRSPNFHMAIGLIASFWIVAAFTDFWDLFLTSNFVIIPLEFLIFLLYLPGFLSGLIKIESPGQALVMGIWINWTADLVQRLWGLVWRFSGQPHWMIVSDFITFILWMRAVGGIIHVTSPAVIEGRVPHSSWVTIALAFVAGLLTMALMHILFGAENLVPF